MLPCTLQQLTEWLSVPLSGGQPGCGDRLVHGVALDSREVEPGMLFVALRGAHVDGHDYAADAAARGAVAMLGQRPVEALPTLLVDDPLNALTTLGRRCRAGSSAQVVALTGSNGKTTVKELLAAMLVQRGPTLATAGNRNNHLGLPQTLCRLRAEHRFAVLEMGANHAGEIGELAAIAEPHVGIVTNAGPAHLEGFGSLRGVATAKGELFSALPAAGAAVINTDDTYADLWHELARHVERRVTFGTHSVADLRYRGAGPSLELWLAERWRATPTPLLGAHNAANAAAAAAAATLCGVSADEIAQALAAASAPPGRLQLRHGRTCRWVIDDSYNANPASLQAGLEVLCELASAPGGVDGTGRRGETDQAGRTGEAGQPWLLLGTMAELGEQTADWHRRAGEQARAAGVAHLWCVGEIAAAAADAFGAGGRVFADVASLAQACQDEVPADAVVLIKGSRAAAMERLVAVLADEPAGESTSMGSRPGARMGPVARTESGIGEES
ncbi:hypothetical protein CKO15_09950 [Halorhodospira abdelmalekii]|uniref:UDP-N-acetylmuramoyl-tripeptide--D-alanyl-D- alanine ligase n=1 Tax=Halorhodospira abdelmalekii TaxID=421629 RepID=UPI0019074513|nr:UDP-N-acetylmuramoyl-tripeptide--D-alanyl-D-alanine ligase [Halorhodospira abdelmalekii]MBK1735601.1 hypothetical protein [Halorhodospira abdelmalekii]